MKILSRIKLSTKVLMLPVLVTILMAVVLIYLLNSMSGRLFEEKSLMTRHVVETAASLIEHYVQQEKQGKLSKEKAQSLAKAAIKALRYEGKEYFWINDFHPRMVMHPYKPSLDGKDLSGFRDKTGKYLFNEMAKTAKEHGAGFVSYMWPKPGVDAPQPKISFVKAIPEWGWIVGSGIYVDDVNQQIRSLVFTVGGLGVAVLALAILLGWWFSRSLTRPLEATVKGIQSAAHGDFTFTPKKAFLERGDELGDMLRNVAKMFVNLSSTVNKVTLAADTVANSAGEVSLGNQDLSNRTQQQASAIEETASALEEMSSSVKHNAGNSQQANTLARKTAEMARQGGDAVQKTVRAMEAVSGSSKKIADIINVVNEIAFQTNLLALNAAVEAARAGEAGRGFAVVAGEVRNLAGRSASAAKEIQVLIIDSVDKVEQGNELVADSGRLLSDIIDNVQAVADTIAEVTAASQEQAQGIDEINKAVGQMDEAVQQNAALVEEAASASENMASAAQELRSQMGRFKVRG